MWATAPFARETAEQYWPVPFDQFASSTRTTLLCVSHERSQSRIVTFNQELRGSASLRELLRAASTAATSGSTRTVRPPARIALRVSLRPLPVIITITRSFGLIVLELIAEMTPASEAAAAGSASTPCRPAKRIASNISSSLTPIKTPCESLSARNAFRQFRGTCTSMLSAMVVPFDGGGKPSCSMAYASGMTSDACTPTSRGSRSIMPNVCICTSPFQMPAIVQPSPTLTATQSGTVRASRHCSATSNPPVFLPSTSTGLIAQLRLYQPNDWHAFVHRSYAASYVDLTANTVAPKTKSCATFGSGAV